MMAVEEADQITERELERLKTEVLKENIEEISTQLGDPGRYFASFKAKDILDHSDCEQVKAQVTSIEKANAFIEVIKGRKGRKGEHPYDVFVGALKRMKVHIHIVRILNQALAKKKAELKTMKRAQISTITEAASPQNGFPSNGIVHPVTASNSPYSGAIVTKGALPSTKSSTPTTSSPSSSSGSFATTPPSYVTSPQTDTDGSLVSPHSNQSRNLGSYDRINTSDTTGELPTLPEGYNRQGNPISDTSQTSFDSSLRGTPTSSDIDPQAGPLPVLPPGFNQDGTRQESITTVIGDSPNENVHPDLGPFPPVPPALLYQNNQQAQPVHPPMRSHTTPEDTFLTESIERHIQSLKQENQQLRMENDSLVKRQQEIESLYIRLDKELIDVKKDKDKMEEDRNRLTEENTKLTINIKRLESYISVLQLGKGVGTPLPVATPTHFPNYSMYVQPGEGAMRRGTEPYIHTDGKYNYHQQRQSEPLISLPPSSYHASRPKNLPLGIPGSQIRIVTSSPRDGPLGLPDARRSNGPNRTSRHSPGSDSSRDGPLKALSSNDDLTSGEDQNSVRSFESGNSGKMNFELSSARNTHGTVV